MKRSKLTGVSPLDLAISFIQKNFDRCLTLGEVSAAAGRSRSWVMTSVRGATGKSCWELVTELRMERAREMLEKTRLSVGEVALACGYATLDRFSHAFRRREGLSPRLYRKRHGKSEGEGPTGAFLRATSVFRQDTSRRDVKEDWAVLLGHWTMRGAVLEGTGGEGEVAISLRRDLSPAFRLKLDLRRDGPADEKARGSVMIVLSDGSGSYTAGYRFLLGCEPKSVYCLDRLGTPLDSYSARFPSGAWHAVELSLLDNRLRLSLDGKTLFDHRELLPVPYRDRCRLVLAAFHATLRIRDFELFSVPLSRNRTAVAVADEHAAEGHHEQALEAYEAQLPRVADSEAGRELLFKIGMTYLRLGFALRARSHLDRFARSTPTTPWGVLAALQSLHTRMDDLSDDDVIREVGEIYQRARTPAARRVVVHFLETVAMPDAMSKGSFDRAAALSRLALDSSDAVPDRRIPLVMGAARPLLLSGRYDRSASIAHPFLTRKGIAPSQRASLRIAVALARTAAGRHDEAEEILRAEDPGYDRSSRGRIGLNLALVRQASGDRDAALASFLGVTRAFPDQPAHADTARENAAMLLAVAGRHDEAEEILRGWSSTAAPRVLRHRVYIRLALLAIRVHYEEMLPLFAPLTGAGPTGGHATIRDNLLLCILHELTGDASRATRNLEVLEKTYADTPMRRWVRPATYLLGKATAMEVFRDTRAFALLDDIYSASLFYMLAMVERKRGRDDAAGELLRYTIETDPLGYWPAILARRERGKLTNP